LDEAEEQAKSSLSPGAFVAGRFRIERLIGRGGMGEVYAARHVTTGKEVALKLIHYSVGTGASGQEQTRRFMREARAATAIQHPNVIEVFDVFVDTDGTPVMVMELLKGETFADYRTRVGAMTLHDTATLLLPAVEALQAAHEKGIVHRDLKPDNIFLAETPAGRATKLLDFGIAKVLDPTKLGSDTEGPTTRTNSMLGTPYYMSFEQAMSDKNIDPRTDIWSMGVILFEALTGRRPMEFDTLGAMYTAFLQGTIPSLHATAPDVPEEVCRVIDLCLRRDRDARLPDLRPLIEVLRRYTDVRISGALSGGRVVSVMPSASALAPVTGGAAVAAGAPTQLAEGSTHSPLSSSTSSGTSGASRRATLLAFAGVFGLVGALGAAGLVWMRRTPASTNPAANTAASTSALPSASSHRSDVLEYPQTSETLAPIAEPAENVDAAAIPTASGAHPPRRPHPVITAPAASGSPPGRVAPQQETPAHGISPQLPY
jgi:eukaryotic-like serine/threonine-protein kinase